MATPPDRLKTYRQKRDFAVTAEPAPEKKGKAKKSAAAPSFMVHKHDATRLHYDVRLEMDGVLASWALPKGPSYDPSVKRLAVATEDHPLAYATFEGRIPDGQYGGGDSLIWDKGTYDTVPPGQASAQRKKGHLHIKLAGEKLQGEWHLVRTRPLAGKEQWLCFKAKDGTERADYDVVAERPESVKSGRKVTRGPLRKKTVQSAHPTPDALLKTCWPPMMATLSTPESAAPATHLFEVKYDGYRAVAAVSGGKLALESRNSLDFALRFPAVAQALAKLKVAEAVIDGEIIAVDAKGVSHFQAMGDGSAQHRYVAFDLLWLDGEDLRDRPLEERRELLESVFGNVKAPLQLSERVTPPPDDLLADARKQGLEGLIAKRRGSTYQGRRSPDWLKLKVIGEQEVALVGYTPISNGTAEIGALLLGVKDDQGFRYVGKVGTGFGRTLRADLLKKLSPLKQDRPSVRDAPRVKGAIWVTPRFAGQVAFSEWTRDGRLRHPSFLGLRDDKTATEATQEKPVKGPEAPVEVTITHPERAVFPESKITKADVAAFYRDVTPYLLPVLHNRPLSFQAWPRGIHQANYFRQGSEHVPPFIHTATVKHADHDVEHILVDRPETLQWLANQSALTLHAMSSHLPTLDSPDWVGFDFDPAGTDWEALVPLVKALHGLLEEIHLKGFPKTSGKRGLHVFVPVAPGCTHEKALTFATKVTEVLGARFPKLATTSRPLTSRKGRLYLDAFQNGRLKTLVAPYSLRAEEGAPVSTPLEWDEVSLKLKPAAFNLRTLPKRLAKVGDLFAPVLRTQQTLPDLT